MKDAARDLVTVPPARPLAAMIVGVPNVGKSTVLNTLAGRTIAKTGNKPAITKMQQRVQAGPDFVLVDTPGFLWPKLEPPASSVWTAEAPRSTLVGGRSPRITGNLSPGGGAPALLDGGNPLEDLPPRDGCVCAHRISGDCVVCNACLNRLVR